MNILIVDDDAAKASSILSIAERCLGDALGRIDVVDCLSEARSSLRNGHWDVLLLDIQIPQAKDGVARIDCGIDFVNELHSPRGFPVPAYTIAISAYDEVQDHRSSGNTDGLYAWLRYNPTENEWEEQLKKKLLYLSNVLAPRSQNSTTYDFDLGVVCALDDVEMGAVLELPWDWSEPTRPDGDDPTSYYFGRTTTSSGEELRIVAAAAPQMGMAAMSVLCMKMISKFRPKYIGMPGIAAGVKKEKTMNFGDVLVAELSWDYGSGKMKIEGGKTTLSPDLRPIPLNPSLKPFFTEIRNNKSLLESISQNSPYKKPGSKELRVHIGPLASGAAVIADEKIVADIVSQQRKLIGIEMEIYGLYYSAANCSSPRPKVFALKSICDYGDRQKTDTYQKYAAYTSANVLQYLVENKLGFEN